MSWSEFCSLLSGIMPETPLGQIVSIRAEKDPKAIRQFTKDQRKIRNEWLLKRNEKIRSDPQTYNAYITNMQRALAIAFSKKEGDK